ncbi:MAG: hypothetical protein ABI082_09475 [Dokdonella sp.]
MQQAEATLDPVQHAQVEIALQSLKQTCGAAITLPRAMKRYASDAVKAAGSHTGHDIGNVAAMPDGRVASTTTARRTRSSSA